MNGTRIRLLAIVIGLAFFVGVLPAAATSPTTPERELAWIVEASNRVPVSDEEQRRHLSTEFLTAIGGTDKVNALLTQVGALTTKRIIASTPTQIMGMADTAKSPCLIIIGLNSAGLINALFLAPQPPPSTLPPTPRTWSEVDTRLRALGTEISFTASVVGSNGQCQQLHGINSTTARPLGSAFKLYVLGALGHAVATHKARWDERLPIIAAWKSLPSGLLQNEPDGTKLTLDHYARLMISISDNTATDHLMHRLGRTTVYEQLTRFGHHKPNLNQPFLTTRELFILKGFHYPHTAQDYLALPVSNRAVFLKTLTKVPLAQVQPWEEPRKIQQLEWFGSPDDICRAYAQLWKQHTHGLTPIGTALSIMDGGIGLDSTKYPTVWYKGGSEPGVITYNHLVRNAHGRLVVTSIMVSDPHNALHPSVALEIAALARGSVHLAQQN